MSYYTLSRVARNLAVAICRRRLTISTTHNLSPRQLDNNLTPISYTTCRNRTIPSLPQSLHCFSSVSTVEDDRDNDVGGADSDDLDGLKSEIERLKVLDIDGGDDVSSFAEGVDINTADDESEGSKLKKSNLFEQLSSSQESSNISTTEDTKPNLSELLSNTDIFAQSWAEPDVEDEEYSYSNSRRSNDYYNNSSRYDRGSNYSRGSEYNNTNNRPRNYRDSNRQRCDTHTHTSSNPRFNIIGRRRNDTWSPSDTNTSISWRDNVNTNESTTTSYQQPSYQSSQQHQTIEQQQPSPIEIKYNKLVDCTNQLLDSLSNNKDDSPSSTLQLMDFDKVMTDWSKFHSDVDNNNTNKNNNIDDGSYNSYSRSTTMSLKTKASNQCMKLLHSLEYNYDCILHHSLLPDSLQSSEKDLPQTKHTQLIPNAASYNLALHTLAHSDHQNNNMAQEAYLILMRMLDRYQKYMDILDTIDEDMSTSVKQLPKPCEPTIITYNSVLHAIAKSGTNDAGHLAEKVFDIMDNERRSSSKNGVLPNARTLASVIDAWSNVKSTNAQQMYGPDRAEAILIIALKKRREFVESVKGVVLRDDHHDEGSEDDYSEAVGEEGIQIVMHEDNIVLDDDDDDVEEEIIDEELQMTTTETISTSSPVVHKSEEEVLVQQRSLSPPFVKPNIVAFNSCIHAWASSGRGREGAHRAQELLAQLEVLSNSGELDLPPGHPDEIHHDVDDNDGIDNSLKPNVRTYSMVMNAWSNVARVEQGSGEDAATHCEDILTKMEEQGAIDSSVRPNLVAYVTSISCWARTRDVEQAASRAENILNRMIDLYYNEDESELPIVDSDVENANHDAPFNSVITSYARSSDPYATERALSVLERLEASPISPTVVTYNAVLDVCAKKGEPDRALEVLEKMKQMPSISVDSTSYDTVLNAFATCVEIGSSERAYNYLCQLEEERLSGESNFTPSGKSYTNVITAFARQSGSVDQGGISTVQRAKEVYDKLMKQIEEGVLQNGDVDSFANSSLLNCCANVYGTRSEKKEALVIAIKAFEDMKKRPDVHGTPNHYSFGIMMKACTRLSADDAEKHRLLEHIFVQACKRGYCSKAVLGQFLRFTPPQLNMKVILSLGGTKRDIPHSWYHNVPKRQHPHSREESNR